MQRLYLTLFLMTDSRGELVKSEKVRKEKNTSMPRAISIRYSALSNTDTGRNSFNTFLTPVALYVIESLSKHDVDESENVV